MSEIITNTFLSGVLANSRGGFIADNNTYRRYGASVRTSSQIGGNEDARLARVFYEIGRVHATKGGALARRPEAHVAVDAAYPTTAVLAEEFVGLSKKYTNFSSTFAYSSLAGVVERIARGLAASSLYPGVDSNDLAAGQQVRVNALGTYDGPVTSLTSTVFIPRLVNSNITGDVFAVLVSAVAGEGGSIASDVVELNAVTREPILPTVAAAGFPKAAVDALRLLGTNMVACDQGPLFALALTRGIHKVVSVVGHTDEGAITRDLLRSSYFGVPFGGIHYGLEPYAGIPALATSLVGDVAAYVDALALTTAAAVAHCDPGQTYNGRWYPTSYSGTGPEDAETRPGSHLAGTQAMAERNRGQLLADLSKFVDVYVPALARIFAAGGDDRVAAAFFMSSSYLLGNNNRHLRYASVSPYYWIEPTSLLPHDAFGTRAESEGSGALATRDIDRELPAWEDIWSADSGDLSFSAYHALVRNPRSAGFFAHWLNHPANGLGAIQVRQLDPNLVVHPGGCDAAPELRDRVEQARPWTDFLWTRGQSPFCAPGEFLNLAGTVGFMVNHYTFDADGIPTLEHVPTAREFLGCTVRLSVGRPQGIPNGASNWGDSTARRARTRATRELAASAARVRAFGRPDVAAMPVMTSAPAARDQRGQPTPARNQEDAGGRLGWFPAAGVDNTTTRGRRGVPVNAVPQHQPVRFPQLARQLGGQAPGGGGGPVAPQGGAPPPPNPPAGDGDDHEPDVPVAPGPAAPPANGANLNE
nr:coat protein [Metarhizium anisopliae M5 victorivirus 1]